MLAYMHTTSSTAEHYVIVLLLLTLHNLPALVVHAIFKAAVDMPLRQVTKPNSMATIKTANSKTLQMQQLVAV